MARISKKRLDMGEEKWAEYQRIRKQRKCKKYDTSFKGRLNSFKVKETRRKIKKLLIEYKGGRCERCGYNKDCPTAYDFHHKNPKEKEFGLGKSNLSLEAQKKEVDKCVLLCSNCHREVHYELDMEKTEQERIEFGFVEA